MSRYNEGLVLDAVIRLIEGRKECCRDGDGRSPDDLNDPDPQRRVDYVCSIGGSFTPLSTPVLNPLVIISRSGSTMALFSRRSSIVSTGRGLTLSSGNSEFRSWHPSA